MIICHHLQAILLQVEWLDPDDIKAYVEAGHLHQLVEAGFKNYQLLFEFNEKKQVQIGWPYAQVLVNHCLCDEVQHDPSRVANSLADDLLNLPDAAQGKPCQVPDSKGTCQGDRVLGHATTAHSTPWG